MKKYDMIVIGAGSAGLGTSGVAKALGLSVLLIEAESRNIGGDCLNYGCVPSKALIHVAKQFHSAGKTQRFGNIISGKADWEKVIAYVHKKQAHIREHENPAYLINQGYDLEIGWAKFIDKKTIEVNNNQYQGKIIVLATGSRPRRIQIPGMEHVHVLTNEELFFDLKKLPENLLVIGGGPVGCEMAQAFSRLGSKVTVVDLALRILSKEKKEYSDILASRFRSEGIAIYSDSKIKAFTSKGEAILESKNGRQIKIPCDTALLSIGRIVNAANMDLEKAGIKLTEQENFQLDKYLRTTNKRVYAIGDASGRYMFSHGAEKQVRLMWKNLINPFKKKDHVRDLSWVTFTDPEIATWGLNESQLRDKGIPFWRQDQEFKEDDRAIVDANAFGHTSILMTANSDYGRRKILGGSMIADNAGEMSQELMLAMTAKIPIQDIFDRVYPYPVGARINQKAIRGVVQKKLTPFLGRVLKFLFRLWH